MHGNGAAELKKELADSRSSRASHCSEQSKPGDGCSVVQLDSQRRCTSLVVVVVVKYRISSLQHTGHTIWRQIVKNSAGYWSTW